MSAESGTWHFIAEFKNGFAKPHCYPGGQWWGANQIERQLRPEDDALTFDALRVTCGACIEAYETAPIPITTADLLDVVNWLQSTINCNDTDAHRLLLLRKRLERPRRLR